MGAVRTPKRVCIQNWRWEKNPWDSNPSQHVLGILAGHSTNWAISAEREIYAVNRVHNPLVLGFAVWHCFLFLFFFVRSFVLSAPPPPPNPPSLDFSDPSRHMPLMMDALPSFPRHFPQLEHCRTLGEYSQRSLRTEIDTEQCHMMMMSWCLMSSDVIWHIRDKLWPMPKHGSIKATYVRCMRV